MFCSISVNFCFIFLSLINLGIFYFVGKGNSFSEMLFNLECVLVGGFESGIIKVK